MKTLYLILACLLVGCVTHIGEPKQSTEHIHAFMLDKNKIYLLGEQSDYLLENQDVSAMRTFLNSPYAKQTLFLTMKLDATGNEVKGEYAVYLDSSKFSHEEKEKLQKDFWFNPISHIHPDLLPAVKARHPNWKANQPALKRQYRAFGKLVKLKNRDEILRKYAMKSPIAVELTKREAYQENIADEIAWELAARTVFVPIYVAYGVVLTAAAVPMMAIYIVSGENITK